MSNNLNLALRLRYDGKAVTTGAQKNVRDLNQLPGVIQKQVAANQRLSATQQKAMTQQGSLTKSLNLLERSYSGVALAITTAISAGTATMFVRDTGAAQLLDQRLKGLTSSSAEYNKVQDYLFNTADRLNTKYTVLSNSYSKLLTLQEAGVISQTQGKAILEGMANAAAKSGASNVQLEQSLFGIAQGMTAGVLRAEELNQVTEPLPGLMQKLDKAAGQAAGGFRRMVNDGQITSQMFKKYLVTALNEYAGAAEATEGKINASFAEMGNEYQRLIRKYEEPVNFAVTSVVDTLTDGMSALRENEELAAGLATSAGVLAAVLSGHLAGAVAKSTKGFVANIAAKNQALLSEMALAKQSQATAILENKRALQQKAYAAHTLKVASKTHLRTKAIAKLATANQHAIATQTALTHATNTYSVAAARASIVSRGLSVSMGLLGGPVGVAVTAALAIAYFATSSDDASNKSVKLEKHIYDLTSAFDSLKNVSARAQLKLNSNKMKNYSQAIAKAYIELKKYNTLASNATDERTAFGYKQKIASIKKYIHEQTELRTTIIKSNAQIANFNNNLDKIKFKQVEDGKSKNTAASELPDNIRRLELSLLAEETRLKAAYENKKQMVVRAAQTDVSNKTKYTAILKNLEAKYTDDVKALTEKRENEKTRTANEAEQKRQNDLKADLENRLAIIKGFSSREALAAYNNELNLEQARQQARVDAKRRASLGLAANDELGEIKHNADNSIKDIERQTELNAASGYHSQREADEAAHQERLFQIKNRYAGSLQQEISTFANFEKQTAADKTKAVIGLGAAGFKAMAGQSKKAFKAYKAFSIAQAIMNTYQSATGAFNSLAPIPIVGPALGAAAAVAAVAMGMQQVRQIKAQQPVGIAHGGLDYVPNESTYLLQRGERVLSPKQNIEISSAAQRINQGSSANNGQNITLNITNQINVEGNTDKQGSEQIGNDIGRQIESYIVGNISENGSIIRAIRGAA
ncbi:tape measure protein [Pseudoalteromonas denitrificans]|uniref:Tape measure domain-containing protein n=1 Tax=Pseudoalteromonas denitrificans DSM 6059 TaxID=1123010 RepID=A0A1I1TFV0_9GAMM|nr:tape measure protein [Pseudoalteromonas denitrificans]SFD55263.1 tape measure domain-containing protein [Pseudoalteromonas denitrificans DSM 6059]